MRTGKRSRVQNGLPMSMVLAALLFVLSGWGAPTSAEGGLPKIEIAADTEGQRLTVDGEDFMVLGMNWGYVPIGTNYSFDLWGKSDEYVLRVIEREMPLLQALGINAIRQYNGIPPRWVQYIYETYGIFTVLNHPMGRYGYNLDGVWYPSTDYSDPKFRDAIRDEMIAIVDEFADTPGILMWLLGNENNYGLSWSSFEIEALPEGEQQGARARHLYSMLGEVIDAIHATKDPRPVAIANGDLQYIDIIVEECPNLDIFGSNVYRGISARNFFQEIKDKLDVPALFTEFGADAFNARTMTEDQISQARYLVGQWQEIYEQSAGKGRVGNAIGGLTFQWNDGWWKYLQETNLEIHDTNASWPNGGYVEDFVEGNNNMNEEWWGICAKGFPDEEGLFENYPRAAYYALQDAYELDPYGANTNIAAIRSHFGRIVPALAATTGHGSRALLIAESIRRARVSGMRLELETINTGGTRVSTPEFESNEDVGYPAFQGFDTMQSFFVDFEAQPSDNVTGSLSLNILGEVPTNPIDEIFYENRGRSRTVTSESGSFEFDSIERVKVYSSDVQWNEPDFRLHGFYRSGHYHWGYEKGDFFGLYREANYGENIDIYNGVAPIGVEIEGRRSLSGLVVALGPELWWGANPAFLAKYQRQIGSFRTTALFHEDIAEQSAINSSSAVPLPETRKGSLQIATTRGTIGLELGGLWSGETKVGESFQIADELSDGSYNMLQDRVEAADAFGAKAKITWQRGGLHFYAQGAYMGLVADGGPDQTVTYTGWHLKDSGSGNQKNVLTGIAISRGRFQISPNFLWQKPILGPIPFDVPAPGRPRNVLDDPFAVRGNRETVGTELLITFDPTPATWMWQWDNDIREDAPFAASLGFIHRHQPTTQDASIGILADGSTTFAFPGAPPARDLWEIRSRIVGSRSNLRYVANFFGGTGEPKGSDTRKITRFGGSGRVAWNNYSVEGYAKFDDWGPYDYHRDGNETFPAQLMADVSRTLGAPVWFGAPQTRFGVRGQWRSLDRHSSRYCPVEILNPLGGLDCDPTGPGNQGEEWEIRTYLHLSL